MTRNRIISIAERSVHHKDIMAGYHCYRVAGPCEVCGADTGDMLWGTEQEVLGFPLCCDSCDSEDAEVLP